MMLSSVDPSDLSKISGKTQEEVFLVYNNYYVVAFELLVAKILKILSGNFYKCICPLYYGTADGPQKHLELEKFLSLIVGKVTVIDNKLKLT